MQIEDADKARRLARTIVSDIALYNRDEIRKGMRDDNIFDLLAEEIERGRKLYVSRVSARDPAARELLQPGDRRHPDQAVRAHSVHLVAARRRARLRLPRRTGLPLPGS